MARFTNSFMRGSPNRKFSGVLLAALFTLAATAATFAQDGRLIRERVHAASLEKNVTGESADRSVSIYLPPSYDSSPNKRYPVLYLLHGIGDTDDTWIEPWIKGAHWQSVPDVLNRGIADRRFGEMIVVMPDARTNWGGTSIRILVRREIGKTSSSRIWSITSTPGIARWYSQKAAASQVIRWAATARSNLG